MYLLDELVQQMPDGVYLKPIKQNGLKVNVSGYAQSNERVSTLMRNIACLAVSREPGAGRDQGVPRSSKRRLSEFNMNVNVEATRRPRTPQGRQGRAKAAGQEGVSRA